MRKAIVFVVIVIICFAGASCEFYGCHGIGYEFLDMCDTSSDSKKSLMLTYNIDFVLNAKIEKIVDEEVIIDISATGYENKNFYVNGDMYIVYNNEVVGKGYLHEQFFAEGYSYSVSCFLIEKDKSYSISDLRIEFDFISGYNPY